MPRNVRGLRGPDRRDAFDLSLGVRALSSDLPGVPRFPPRRRHHLQRRRPAAATSSFPPLPILDTAPSQADGLERRRQHRCGRRGNRHPGGVTAFVRSRTARPFSYSIPQRTVPAAASRSTDHRRGHVADGSKIDYEGRRPPVQHHRASQRRQPELADFHHRGHRRCADARRRTAMTPPTAWRKARPSALVGITASSTDPNGPGRQLQHHRRYFRRRLQDRLRYRRGQRRGRQQDRLRGAAAIHIQHDRAGQRRHPDRVANLHHRGDKRRAEHAQDSDATANSVAEGAAIGTRRRHRFGDRSERSGRHLRSSPTVRAAASPSTPPPVWSASPTAARSTTRVGRRPQYTITVQASDGSLTTSQTFTIAVTDVAPSTPVDNETPPTLWSKAPPTAPRSASPPPPPIPTARPSPTA